MRNTHALPCGRIVDLDGIVEVGPVEVRRTDGILLFGAPTFVRIDASFGLVYSGGATTRVTETRFASPLADEDSRDREPRSEESRRARERIEETVGLAVEEARTASWRARAELVRRWEGS